MMFNIYATLEYKMIAAYYRDKTAERSGVPLINHIHEGITVLRDISATNESERAFCLHPLLQNDEDLKINYPRMMALDTYVVMLAMEYRNVANAYLSHMQVDEIRLSPLFEVNDMLIADKVQNYKDFLTYHHGTHPRSNELDAYFKRWLDKLGVDYESTFKSLCESIDQGKKKNEH